ncbi:ribonuclease III [Mycoplasmopsis canis UFG4]|uniref:Ribonuclease 3 n=1 Tax=Mycoplasmopsis canis UFG4 TaxID=1131455 RepID=I1A6N5_9BACT|nr:ribonuclease III [Mycoplasmopsis canis]AKF41210.1 ribonuclease III [Mycoplasmopsis canis]EIE40394.1 ribonuclease III [Mycoplasmopsis canis UF31]EIE40678.1 ribonuclease III [Mycoplasmopsis canis UF33]EIE41960.1 ribonuclease III [Mycoplasmopsis canis UFG1]EIE42156.1 ribonuclease III [Mycoplasmopsis canis UFG4]
MSSYSNNVIKFLEKENIEPNNLDVFYQATTHKSFNGHEGKTFNYEKLEFLGDSILDFVVSSYIFYKNKESSQGELTRYRSSIVQTETLSEISKKIGLLKLLRTGPGQMHEEVIESTKVQADIFEAMIGAIFVDQGLIKVKKFIEEHLLSKINENNDLFITDSKDPKTELQEHFQSFSRENISYIVEEKGNKLFEAKAVHDKIVYGVGQGSSKKEAETNAAKNALKKLK